MTSRQRPGAAESNYLTVLRRPRVSSFVGFSAAGRLGISIVPLSIILMVAAEQNSYAAAGLCGGSFALTGAVLSPARARLVDEKGTAVALALLASPFVLALAAFTLSAARPLGFTLAISALVGAFTPPIGAATKSQLSTTFHAPVQMQRAFAVDTVVDIGVLTAGPMIAGFLVSFASPTFALAAAATLVTAGCIGMKFRELSHAAAPPTTRQTTGRTWWFAGLQPPISWALVFSMVGVGAALGTFEIAVPAFANAEGNPAAAGVILGLFFGASALASLAYGARHWTMPAASRYRAAVLALGIASLPLLLAQDLVTLALLVLLPGASFGPALISAYLIAQESSPIARRAEANAWISTANNAGAAVGLAMGGLVADQLSAAAGFGAAALLAGLGACLTPATEPTSTCLGSS